MKTAANKRATKRVAKKVKLRGHIPPVYKSYPCNGREPALIKFCARYSLLELQGKISPKIIRDGGGPSQTTTRNWLSKDPVRQTKRPTTTTFFAALPLIGARGYDIVRQELIFDEE